MKVRSVREAVFIVTAIFVLCGFAWSVYEKEELIRTGETVFLKLAPRDPRSLMQGDYMQLNYALGNQIAERYRKPVPQDGELSGLSLLTSLDGDDSRIPKHGYAVISTGKDGVAWFVRMHDGTSALAAGEMLVKFKRGSWRVEVVPNSFMFQEGYSKYFDGAKYGVLKMDNAGHSVLIGLAGEDMKIIDPQLTAVTAVLP